MADDFNWERCLKSAYQLEVSHGNDIARDSFEGIVSNISSINICNKLECWSTQDISSFIQSFTDDTSDGSSLKSNDASESWRQKGNSLFQRKLYVDSLHCYTESVLTASYSSNQSSGDHCASLGISTELALALGNRSAALYYLGYYQQAVTDCDRALACGYPSALHYKIIQRKGKCLLSLGQTTQAQMVLRQALTAKDEDMTMQDEDKTMQDEDMTMQDDRKSHLKAPLDKLINDSQTRIQRQRRGDALTVQQRITHPSQSLPNCSASLTLHCNMERGRYLVAGLPIAAGELLISEMPYAAVVLPEFIETHCNHCSKKTLNPIPCLLCADVRYCSIQCWQLAKEGYHWLECGHAHQWHKMGPQAILSLRMLLQAKRWCVVQRVVQRTKLETSSDQPTHETAVHKCVQSESKRGNNIHETAVQHVNQQSDMRNAGELMHETAVDKTNQENNGHGTAVCERVIQSSKFWANTGNTPSETTVHNLHSDSNEETTNVTVGNLDNAINPSRVQPDPMKVMSGDRLIAKISREVVCDCNSSDRYLAVYNLVNHSDKHSAQEQFTMSMTAILLAKCFHSTLSCSLPWSSCIQDGINCNRDIPAMDIKPTPPNDTRCDNPARSLPHSMGAGRVFSFSIEDVAVILLRHMQQLKCNSHAVTAVQIEDRRVFKQQSTACAYGATSSSGLTVDTTRQVRLATAVYATTSLLNHSCEPNVIASFDGDVLAIRATVNIPAGSEILHCYGPHANHMDTEERQRLLAKQYFFTCDCRACRRIASDDGMEASDWSTAYGCSLCAHQIVATKTIARCSRETCDNVQNLAELAKKKRKADDLFAMSCDLMERKRMEECISSLHECLRIQQRILYKYHKSLAKTHDCLAKGYASIGDYRQSGKYLQLSLVTVEKQYGSESIEFANELNKLARVYFNGAQIGEARMTTDHALKLFRLHYGTTHPDVLELEQMKQCLLSS